MKQISLHLSFWVVYIIQDSLMMFTWVQPIIPGLSDYEGFFKAIYAAIIALIPKLVITYYILYFSIPKAIAKEERIFWIGLKISLVLIISILIYRILFNS